MKKLAKFITAHKFWSIVIATALVFAVYKTYGYLTDTSGETRYVLAAVKKETIVTSVSGTGQVSAANEIEVKSKAGGEVTAVNVTVGQWVANGAPLLQLDTRDAEKAVRDAKANLATAELTLEKLRIGQTTSNTSQVTADKLRQARHDGLAAASRILSDLFPLLDGLDRVLFGNDLDQNHRDHNITYYTNTLKSYDQTVLALPDRLERDYRQAKDEYSRVYIDYTATNQSGASDEVVDQTIESTYRFAKQMNDLVKTSLDLVKLFKDKSVSDHWTPDQPAVIDEHLATLTTYYTTASSDLSTISDYQNTISELRRTTAQEGIDSRAQELTVEQRRNALADAQTALADYIVRAPFAGIVAQVNIKRAETIGGGTAVATLITPQKIAEVSLNEVDVTNVKIGQPATITFDAVDGLTITGRVTEIDLVGTESQGVVTYSVKIGFDTRDERVKPGMSTSAAIVTDVQRDVLVVPNSAVKARGDTSYVETLTDLPTGNSQVAAAYTGTGGITSIATPTPMDIEIGTANDSLTEIVSGLKEGDLVIIRTITPTTQTAPSAPSIFGGPGGSRSSGATTIRLPR